MGVLESFGITSTKVIVANTFSVAEALIAEKKPKLLITEYEINKKLGMSLIEKQSKHLDSLSRISILLARNKSDCEVAQAAEEVVDTYMARPYSYHSFTDKLTKAILSKLEPSIYIQTIEAGKKQYFAKAFFEAAKSFEAAKLLHPKPTLACYYLGLTYQRLGNSIKAIEEFKEGRLYQPLHYKCLRGEFETLIFKRKYQEAYQLVPIFLGNYPITPHLLGQFFTAAVFAERFEDLKTYYKLFFNFKVRSSQLKELASLAFLNAARYYLKKKDIATAASLFDMGLQVTTKDLSYIETIVMDLLKFGYIHEAKYFMTQVQLIDLDSDTYAHLNYLVHLEGMG